MAKAVDDEMNEGAFDEGRAGEQAEERRNSGLIVDCDGAGSGGERGLLSRLREARNRG